jgi:hypothetical protein
MAVVKQSYYKGSHYLIKAVFDRKVVFFEHDVPLELNEEVTLMIRTKAPKFSISGLWF